MEADNTAKIDKVRCMNCDTPIDGQFCQSCGQRYRSERLSLKILLLDIPSQWFNLNRGFFHTFVQHFKTPGSVAGDFVAGRRVTYTNPLTYYLIGAAAQLFMLFIFGDVLSEKIMTDLKQSPETLEMIQGSLGENPAQKYAELYLSVINQGYTYLGFIFLCIPFALLLRLFSKQHRTTYNTAETLVFSFFTMGHFVLCTALLGFITMPINMEMHAPISVTICFVFGWLSCRGFYGKQQHRGIASFFALLFTFVIFLSTLIIVMGIALHNH